MHKSGPNNWEIGRHTCQPNKMKYLKKYIYKYLKKVYNRNREEWDTNVWETLVQFTSYGNVQSFVLG